MLILGIDPGLALMGYGLIQADGDDLTAIDYGVISTPAGENIASRLCTIYSELTALIERYLPAEVAIENFIAIERHVMQATFMDIAKEPYRDP